MFLSSEESVFFFQVDLEEEFDPEEHDRQMAALYDDGYYDGKYFASSKYFSPSKYFAPRTYFTWQRCMTMATMSVNILPRLFFLPVHTRGFVAVLLLFTCS